jgi:flavin reductase (DIM6/NTAB) family NADH-FMN oxidoreductase RutF
MLRSQFLEGMSRAASTVSIVTTDGPSGRAGVTISAMTAVSADSAAPSLLVCVHHLSKAALSIRANGIFCVNILRDDHSHIADVFAGRNGDAHGNKFGAGEWTILATGAPVLTTALVAFDCTLVQSLQHGTHWLFIGELVEVNVKPSGTPLVYADRSYRATVPLVEPVRRL